MTLLSLQAKLRLALAVAFTSLLHVSGEKKVDLRAGMLKYQDGLFQEKDFSTSYENAVDGQLGQEWNECAISKKTNSPVWLSIDLGQLYSVNKVRMLSRKIYGRDAEIYVGRTPISQTGTSVSGDHKCGNSSYPAKNAHPNGFTDFVCAPICCVQYVTIRRKSFYLQVCEVEVYYDEAANCEVSAWSTCSSSCGMGTRKRQIVQETIGNDTDCLPQSRICIEYNCGPINMMSAMAVASVKSKNSSSNNTIDPAHLASLAIDGLLNGQCVKTAKLFEPWWRVDLQVVYFITSVEAIFKDVSGNGTVVRVGSDPVNGGNRNPQCGHLFLNEAVNYLWNAATTCKRWGRYINVQKSSLKETSFELCELKATYQLEPGLFLDDEYLKTVNGTYSYTLREGEPLNSTFLCGISPDVDTNLTSYMAVRWKLGNETIPILASNSSIGQRRIRNMAGLIIKEAPSRSKTFTCFYTWIGESEEYFNLDVILIHAESSKSSAVAAAVSIVVILLILAAVFSSVFFWHRIHSKGSPGAALFGDENSTLLLPVSQVIEVYEGSTVVLPCYTIGDCEIQWYRGEESLPSKDTHFDQIFNGSLQITAARESDSGVYRWVASSKSGLKEQALQLVVKTVAVREGHLGGFSELVSSQSISRPKPQSHEVSLADFPDYVSSMNESRGAGFIREFEDLKKAGFEMVLTCKAATANDSKNRYRNIKTYDHARVILKPAAGAEPMHSDYIAAAYVDSHRIPKKYIASQGPAKFTAGDMWRMIWGENVSTIVMLTHLIEGNKIKCYQYWPSDVGEPMDFAGFNVTLDSVASFAEYVIRSLNISLGKETRQVRMYHFTSWPDHGVPKFATGLLSFIRRVNRELSQNSGPVVVHCSAGVGRTGTFIVIDQMLERISEGLSIDVFTAVKSLRTRRQDMVQTDAQYAFIYVALLEAVFCGKTQIPAQNIRSAFAKLSEEDENGRTGFERQYLVLQTSSSYENQSLFKCGLHPSVHKKNRYSDIVPLDTERVVLRMEGVEIADDNRADNPYSNVASSNYINASYVNGYRRRDAYIVTQGPMENTVNDFWKMVWEQDTRTIVSLTQLVEDGEEFCYQYWPKRAGLRSGSLEVKLQSEIPFDSFTVRRLIVIKASDVRTICQFHFTAWPNGECPKSAANLLSMMAQVEKWQQTNGNNVVTVHCNNGIGRSGVFCTIVSVIEEMKVENSIDIFYKVKSLRIKRPGAVQNADQYKFCFKAILDYTDGFDTYSNFK